MRRIYCRLNASSIKTRIETARERDDSLSFFCLNASSIKTRIETGIGIKFINYILRVLTPLPLKQGLKQRYFRIEADEVRS